MFACGARPPPAPPGLLLPGAALGLPVFASVRPRGDGVTQRWYLALSGSSSMRWEPLYWPRSLCSAAVPNYPYLCTCARHGPAAVARMAERSPDGLGRAGSRAGAPRAEIGGVGLPLRLPRDQLELRVGVVRRPTARPREAAHLGLGERRARAPRFRERARELERRGRPGTARDGDHPGAARAGASAAPRASRLLAARKPLGMQSSEPRALRPKRTIERLQTARHTRAITHSSKGNVQAA